jgi:hypothetical protein
MKAQSKNYTLPHGNGFDALEVHTCFDDPLIGSDRYEAGDEIIEGSFYTLYGGHVSSYGLECIGDFTTFEAACAVAEKLGGLA